MFPLKAIHDRNGCSTERHCDAVTISMTALNVLEHRKMLNMLD